MENNNHTSMALDNKQQNINTSDQKSAKKYMQIQKGEQTKFKFQKVKLCNLSLLIFGIFNMLLSLLYYEADYAQRTALALSFLHVSSGISILFTFVCLLRYKFKLQLEKSQRILDESQTLYSSGKIWHLFMQLAIFYTQPYSFLNNAKLTTYNAYEEFQYGFKINYMLLGIGLNKIFFVIRYILVNQPYLNPKSHRLCKMYGASADYLYAIKCLFKDRPLILILAALGVSFTNFCYCLRIAERDMLKQYRKYYTLGNYPTVMNTFDDTFWFSFSTIMRVGFGDFVPKTVMGRFISALIAIWGTIIISLLVISLTNTFNLNQNQKRALIVLNRLQIKKQLKEAAAFMITICCRRYLARRYNKKCIQLKLPFKQFDEEYFQYKYHKYLLNFKNIQQSIGSMHDLDDIHEDLTRQFQILGDQMKEILTNQKNVLMSVNPKYKTQYSLIQRNFKRSEGLNRIFLYKKIFLNDNDDQHLY